MKKILLGVVFSISFFAVRGQACSNSIIKFQPSGECEGRDIQLVASITAPGNIYEWSCPNPVYNSTSGPFLFIPMSCLLDSGTYTLTVTDTEGCSAVAATYVNVIPKPIVSISGQAFACLGVTTKLYANDVAGNFGPYTYNWDNGQAKKSINIKHNGGTFPHPSCVITNSYGCSAANQTAFMIGTINPPFSDVSYSGLTSFCAPNSLELSAPLGNMVFYQWRKNGKNINGATSNMFKAGSSGNYKVIVSDLNGCSDTSDVVAVTVFPRPSASVTSDGPLSFCTGDSIHLTAEAGAGYVYQWRKNGVPINGATNISFTAKKTGNYRVEIITNHDCVRLTDAQVVTTTACREEEAMNESNNNHFRISAYPNPTSQHFSLKIFTGNDSPVELRLFDILGKEVLYLSGISAGSEVVFGDDFNPGIYSARISQEGLVKVIRLIKNN